MGTIRIGIELQMLASAVAFGLLHLLLAAVPMTAQRSLEWNVRARDGRAAHLAAVSRGRIARSATSWILSLLFAAAVLAMGPRLPSLLRGAMACLSLACGRGLGWACPGMKAPVRG